MNAQEKPKRRKLRVALVAAGAAAIAYIHISADRLRERLAVAWGSFTAAAGALSLGDIAIITGIICTILSLLINWYYKNRDDKRKEMYFRQKGVALDE